MVPVEEDEGPGAWPGVRPREEREERGGVAIPERRMGVERPELEELSAGGTAR